MCFPAFPGQEERPKFPGGVAEVGGDTEGTHGGRASPSGSPLRRAPRPRPPSDDVTRMQMSDMGERGPGARPGSVSRRGARARPPPSPLSLFPFPASFPHFPPLHPMDMARPP